MVRIVHNLTLRPLKIARHLIPDIIWRLINFPLVISATLNVENVSCRLTRWHGSTAAGMARAACLRAKGSWQRVVRSVLTLLLAVRDKLARQRHDRQGH